MTTMRILLQILKCSIVLMMFMQSVKCVEVSCVNQDDTALFLKIVAGMPQFVTVNEHDYNLQKLVNDRFPFLSLLTVDSDGLCTVCKNNAEFVNGRCECKAGYFEEFDYTNTNNEDYLNIQCA